MSEDTVPEHFPHPPVHIVGLLSMPAAEVGKKLVDDLLLAFGHLPNMGAEAFAKLILDHMFRLVMQTVALVPGLIEISTRQAEVAEWWRKVVEFGLGAFKDAIAEHKKEQGQ